jgi:aminoacyl tRNA synthase complex-interacting multifunctional protein 1
MGLSLKVDSKTSVAGKTIALVVARAGVEDKIALSEGAAAIALDAGADGQLEGLATVAKYVASLSADAAALDGTTPEEQATVAEWCQRAVAEYGATGAVADDKLEALDAHLLKRSYVATPGGLSLADLLVYGAVHASVVALSADKLAAMCNLARWCDHVGAVSGGDATFGKIPVVHIPKLVFDVPVADKKEKEKGGDKKGGDKKAEKGGDKKAEKGGDKAKGDGAAAAEGGKKEKKEKKDKPKKEPQAKKEVTVDVLDIRVGTITKAWEHPDADKLWVESIDVGEEKERQVVSGLRAFKTKEQMEGARVCVLCNVKKGPLRDQLSEGMVMCASNEDHTVVDFVAPPAGAKNGEKVTFEGFTGEPVEVLVPKKKMFEACAPKLKTDDDGVACYDGIPFATSAGPCTSTLKGAFIK